MKFFGLTVLVALVSSACESGYQKENGEWAWVSYDEGAGKRVVTINDVDKNSFNVLQNETYATDKNFVYLKGVIIPDADPGTFEVINETGFAKDQGYVFLDLEKVIHADPSTFEYLRWPYSRDANRVFCGNIPMNVPSPAEFQVTSFEVNTSKISYSKSYFIESNPTYTWLDSVSVNKIIVGNGSGKTHTAKYKDYKIKEE